MGLNGKKKDGRLRSGYTTGACAAAAAKAALLKLLRPEADPGMVSIPFPDGTRHEFELFSLGRNGSSSSASVIKDAGDDPDVTNGAEISARVRMLPETEKKKTDGKAGDVIFKAGAGVGTVTRKGLAVAEGEPAINPGPRMMIRAAIREAFAEASVSPEGWRPVEVSVSIKNGESLSKNTLNPRLGIAGGLSILGTTGIVRPVSAKAWTDTIEVCLNVAEKAGLEEIILSTGRTSERAVQDLLGLPDEALVMMGDYLEYAMKAAGRRNFKRLHLAGMWAKILKAALEIPQTHVRHGALDMKRVAGLLLDLGLPGKLEKEVSGANTARQVLEMLLSGRQEKMVQAVCSRARDYAQRLSGIEVRVHLVTPDKMVLVSV